MGVRTQFGYSATYGVTQVAERLVRSNVALELPAALGRSADDGAKTPHLHWLYRFADAHSGYHGSGNSSVSVSSFVLLVCLCSCVDGLQTMMQFCARLTLDKASSEDIKGEDWHYRCFLDPALRRIKAACCCVCLSEAEPQLWSAINAVQLLQSLILDGYDDWHGHCWRYS